MSSAERDEDQIHLRDVHMYVSVPAKPTARIQNAGYFNLQHTLHISP